MAEQAFSRRWVGEHSPPYCDTQKSAPRFTFFSAIRGIAGETPLIAPQEIISPAQLEPFDQFLLRAVVQQADLVGL
jgi:hypothetical protein